MKVSLFTVQILHFNTVMLFIHFCILFLAQQNRQISFLFIHIPLPFILLQLRKILFVPRLLLFLQSNQFMLFIHFCILFLAQQNRQISFLFIHIPLPFILLQLRKILLVPRLLLFLQSNQCQLVLFLQILPPSVLIQRKKALVVPNLMCCVVT